MIMTCCLDMDKPSPALPLPATGSWISGGGKGDVSTGAGENHHKDFVRSEVFLFLIDRSESGVQREAFP